MKTFTLRNGQDCVVRNYLHKDYPGVKEVLEDTKLFEPTWDSERSLKELCNMSPGILVAAIEEKIIGCVYITIHGHWAHLWRLAVHSSHRNQGVGTLLLDTAQKILKLAEIPEVAILVNEDNESLKEYYTARGWNTGGVYRSMWKEV